MSETEQQQSTEVQETEQAEQQAVEEVADDSTQAATRKYYGREILLSPTIAEFKKQQSVPVEGQEHVRRSPRVGDGQFMSTMFEDVHTVHEMFIRGYNTSKIDACLGWRPDADAPYSWITYQEVYDRVHRTGSGLISKGAQANSSQRIGIFSQNNVAWVVMDRACAAYSMVSVPLYDTLGAEALVHIVSQCDLGIILIDSNARAKKVIADAKSGKTSSVRLIILVDEPDDDTQAQSKETGIEVITLKDLEEVGSKSLQEFVPPKPEDLYTICYTSGTTGTPKGVMHSHINVVSMACSFLVNSSDYYYTMTPSDVYISYLPLAHVLERYILAGILMHGCRIGFYRGNPKTLMDDAAVLRPTVFAFVPRLINRIYSKIMAAVGDSGLRRIIFNICLGRKMAALKHGRVSNDTFWDKLIFHKFQASLGGRVKVGVSAAAPISTEVLNVVRCVMGIPIVEAYGQTESTSGVTCTIAGDFEGGNVGSILPCNEIKLVDVPEKEYSAKDGKGEICVKGLTVFMGYFEDEEKTKETIDEDGWLHTGDVGEWLPNGTLKIIDRRKNIFKLSQGEYIAPEKIEQIYMMSDPVSQIYVHGDSLKSSLVAIVVPDEDALARWCKGKDVDVAEKSFADLCAMDRVNELILEDINKVGRHHGLKSFELARKIHVISEAFTIENGMMTPSLKTRRIKVEQRYRAEIDRMYEGAD